MMRVGSVRDRGHADEKEHIRAKHPRFPILHTKPFPLRRVENSCHVDENMRARQTA